jgi:uncharacterized protein YoaH (UPF0181 family)
MHSLLRPLMIAGFACAVSVPAVALERNLPASAVEVPGVADFGDVPAVAPTGLGAVGIGDRLMNLGASSGTAVGNRAQQLRADVMNLQGGVSSHLREYETARTMGAANAVQYQSTSAAIRARLQTGTTPGNPILVRQWEEAQANLDQATIAVARLNNLATEVASDASNARFLLESVRAAYALSGAVEEDHDQLAVLEDEVNQTVVVIDRLSTQVSEDIQRQNAYLASERANMQTLASAINKGRLFGASLSNVADRGESSIVKMDDGARGMMMPAPAAAPQMPVQQAPAGINLQQPAAAPQTMQLPGPMSSLQTAAVDPASKLLAMIRFSQPYVNYEQQLYHSVEAALQARPQGSFTIVAVAPVRGEAAATATAASEAQRDADAVRRSLIQFGLPVDRISIASSSSDSAGSPEVHVYIR